MVSSTSYSGNEWTVHYEQHMNTLKLTDIVIRPETIADEVAIEAVVIRAYQNVTYSDHTEQVMIRRLRESRAYVPELALVAMVGSEIVGHIMLTRISIRDQERVAVSLALAPLSVAPAFQGRGVGSALVVAAHDRARALGSPSIVLLGIPEYYPRFEYEPLRNYDIAIPFDIREENCMILPLQPNALDGVRGVVDYPPEWTER